MASSEHRVILARPWRTIVDIGANRGQFALAAREWTKAQIVSFEPLPGAVQVFRHALEGDARVRVHQLAIGPDVREGTMHVSGRDDSSSLLAIGGEQSRLFPGTGEVGTLSVRVAPLSSTIDAEEIAPPALLKLDVQGYEYDALLGCENLLSKFSGIYCECSFIELYEGQRLAFEVIALLVERGFVLSGMYNPTYDDEGRCIQADLWFSSSDRT